MKAHNVFHHFFYEGAVDIDKIKDSVKRIAAISFIHNFGQMPKQVCDSVHVCTDTGNICVCLGVCL